MDGAADPYNARTSLNRPRYPRTNAQQNTLGMGGRVRRTASATHNKNKLEISRAEPIDRRNQCTSTYIPRSRTRRQQRLRDATTTS